MKRLIARAEFGDGGYQPSLVPTRTYPGGSSEQRIVAAAHDVSEGGVGLICRGVLPIGAHILLREAERGDDCPWVPARVVHSVPAAGGYRVGVQFELDRAG